MKLCDLKPVLVLVCGLSAATLAVAADPMPVGPGGDWRLVFADEFSGPQLDLTKWRPNWLGPDDKKITKPINVEEVSCYDPAQVRVDGGELKLLAEKRACDKWDYASGIVESNTRFNFSYGYAEARMWLPKGNGLWPAFWLNGPRNPADGEIDVIEASGQDDVRYHYHFQCGEKRCSPGKAMNLPGATSGWHTYAVEWQPGKIDWYYDGRKVNTQSSDVSGAPHYVILNLGLRKNPDGFAVPSTLRVDYVRVWQRP